MKCGRCCKPTNMTIMSMFNAQELCPGCKDEESAHPDYSYARDREAEACRQGNFNFPGVGWPGKDGRVQR